MNGVKKECLSCTFFRLKAIDAGICRVDRNLSKDFPIKKTQDICERWSDAGQQYYIRTGWIKAQISKNVQAH